MEFYYYLIVGVLLLFSAFFSASDMIYGIVDQAKLKEEAEKGNKKAKIALKLASNYEMSISSILFANNLVNIFASSIVTIIGVSINKDTGASIAAIIFTVIVIIVGEFLPKAFAKRFNYTLAKAFAYPVQFVVYLFFIFTYPIASFFKLFTKLFQKKAIEEDIISDKVLDEMVDEIEETGEFKEEEAEIIRGAIDLLDIEAHEIMTPRVDVFAIDIDDDMKEIIHHPDLLEYSRVPVYKETIDNIIGIIPIKELSRKLLNNEEIDLESLMFEPIRIPHNYQIIDLLEDFKKKKIHIAIVIDEYGGTEGIITMEDILEEVVGDIFDETDEIKEDAVKVRKGVYVVDGMMNLYDVFELIGCEDEIETDYDTIGGFCQEYIKGFAKVGDTFKFSHFKVKILDADEYTVQKLQIRDIRKKKQIIMLMED